MQNVTETNKLPVFANDLREYRENIRNGKEIRGLHLAAKSFLVTFTKPTTFSFVDISQNFIIKQITYPKIIALFWKI